MATKKKGQSRFSKEAASYGDVKVPYSRGTELATALVSPFGARAYRRQSEARYSNAERAARRGTIKNRLGDTARQLIPVYGRIRTNVLRDRRLAAAGGVPRRIGTDTPKKKWARKSYSYTPVRRAT